IPMILYGALVEESVAKLFMAGIIPGLVLAGLFSLYILVRSLISPSLAPAGTAATSTLKGRDALHVLPLAALMVVVLGGIYSGITTPTEAAALGAVGALVLALAYRQLTLDALKVALMSTVRTTSMVMMIVISAQILSAALTYTGVSRGV